MDRTRRGAIGLGLAATAAPGLAGAAARGTAQSALRPVKVAAPRAFAPSWASLTAGYSAPDWFRDAKFGIWAQSASPCPAIRPPLTFRRTGEALEVTLPDRARDPLGVALVIAGTGLVVG